MSDAGSPAVSPPLRQRGAPAVAEGVPLERSAAELELEILKQQLVSERERTVAEAERASKYRAECALAQARLRKLLGDAGVSPPASSDDDNEIAAKRQRVGEAHERGVYKKMTEAAHMDPPRAEPQAVLGERVVARVRKHVKQAATARGLHRALDAVDVVLGLPEMAMPEARSRALGEIIRNSKAARGLAHQRDDALERARVASTRADANAACKDSFRRLALHKPAQLARCRFCCTQTSS